MSCSQSRDEHSSSPVNPLAERAWQLQQQLQHLQTLQVMQSQQHAAAGSQRSSIDGRGSFDGGAGMAVPHMQAGNPRQALVQQQLQAQVPHGTACPAVTQLICTGPA